MKRLTLALLLAAACLELAAQDGSGFVKQLVENNRVSFNYSVSPKGQKKVKMEGKAVIDGNCYHLSGNELEIYCDGKTKWTLDGASKEVYIEPGEGTRDFLANPSAWIDKVKDLKVSDTEISGTYNDPEQGQSLVFKFSSISSLPLSGSSAGFVLDTSGLGSDWVITDLR